MPRISPPRHLRTLHIEMPLPTKHKGAHSELIACAWLLSQGYEVFRNVSPFGITDIIAQKGARILLLDVKSGATGPSLTRTQREAGVLALRVTSSGHCQINFTSS